MLRILPAREVRVSDGLGVEPARGPVTREEQRPRREPVEQSREREAHRRHVSPGQVGPAGLNNHDRLQLLSDPVALAGHEIGTNALRPGMALARDLVGKDGVMLLAADFVLDENLIRQLRELEASEGSRLTVAIRPPQGA